MFQSKFVTAFLAFAVFLLGLGSSPLVAQNQGTGGSVSVTIAKTEDINVMVVSGSVTVSAGVVVQANATYFEVKVPKDDHGKPVCGPVKKVTWKFYIDRNGNNKFDEGDQVVDEGTSTGPNLEQSFLLGNLTVNRRSDNQRLVYDVDGDKTVLHRDTALGGVF